MTRAERRARAEKKRQEYCDNILLMIRASIDSGKSLESAIKAGDDHVNYLVKNNPGDIILIRHGAIRAGEWLQGKYDEAMERIKNES